jgi:hypothetical protein
MLEKPLRCEVSRVRHAMLPRFESRVSLSNRKLLLAAAFSNVLIIGICFAINGMNAEGAGVATRSTARFAICFFLAGFAGPGLRKWLPWYPDTANLIQAFVAAQMVHFCAVIALHTKFAAEPLQLGGPEIAITLVGFSIVLGVGITAPLRRQSHILYRAAHRVLLYMIWLILVADYARHPIKPLRFVATLVVIALVLRHLPQRHATKPESKFPASATLNELDWS